MNNNSIKVLLIENNPDHAKLIIDHSDRFGHYLPEIVVAKSQLQALKLLNEHSFNAIILDLYLPDSSELETVMRIRDENQDAPIIVLTSVDNESLGTKAIQSGAQDFLVKEKINSELLERSIHYAIERHKLQERLKNSNEREHHLAYHDLLTDLPNRQMFCDRLKQAVIRADREKTIGAVMFLDLDDFKRFNDSYGHSTGDYLLQTVAARLIHCVRECDSVARISGDEYTIMLEKINQSSDAIKVAEKILLSLSKPIIFNGHKHYLTSSIGISLYPKDSSDDESLIKYADNAMYHAKKNGKNNIQLYDKSFDMESIQNLGMKHRLQLAIDNNEIILHYQPQVSIKSGEITGLEALVRWQHPESGLIYPADFLPLAEEMGLIGEIDQWVMYKACKQNKAWQNSGFSPIPIAVNLSAWQFLNNGLPQIVNQILLETNLSPAFLEIELAENIPLQNMLKAKTIMKQLKDMGVRLSVDDFGTKNSSLAYLRNFPVDTLKIDQTFICNIPNDTRDTAMAAALIAFSHKLGLNTIAEGVETDEQLTFLRSECCDQMQGFLFSRALSTEDISNLLLVRSKSLISAV